MSYRSELEDWNKKKKPKIIGSVLFWGITGLLLGLLIVRIKDRIGEDRSLPEKQAEESLMSAEELSSPEALSDNIHQGLYCYEFLTEAEKCWYVEMYDILDTMQEEGELTLQPSIAVEEAELDKVFQCLMNDHPELFFVKGYTYTLYTYAGETAKLGFTGMYTMDAAEREEKQKQIEARAELYLQGISQQASDYEKVKYVYETIVLETEYLRDAEESQNIYSVFVNHESVCQGYAKAVQYLLMELEVRATLVKGTVYGGENHAWNLVWIDGNAYYMDATWGDASYQITEEEEETEETKDAPPIINYDYLCVTTEQLTKTHLIDNIVPLPECLSIDANYYVMEGAYFTDYDQEALADFFERRQEEKTGVTLKCSDEEVFELFYRHLIDEQAIFDYMDAAGSTVAYSGDLEQYSMTFWLVND